MIGTYFLFLYWPSFNAAIGVGSQQVRAAITTVLSITSSGISAMFISRLMCNGKFDVEILLNSTLAGGVAMGAAADLIVKPYYAMICGWLTGAVSALGYTTIGPFLKEKINLHDTCGIHNLHAMTGVMGSIIAAITTNKNALNSYGSRYDDFFLEHVNGRSPAV